MVEQSDFDHLNKKLDNYWDFVAQEHKDAAEAKKINNSLIDFESIESYTPHERKMFWSEQAKIDSTQRIRSYRSNLQRFLRQFSSATEEDYLEGRIKIISHLSETADLSNPIQKSVYFHLKRHLEFLKDILSQLTAEKNGKESEG